MGAWALPRPSRLPSVQVYTLSLRLLAEELRSAHERGVRVRVMTDDEEAKARDEQLKMLAASGIDR